MWPLQATLCGAGGFTPRTMEREVSQQVGCGLLKWIEASFTLSRAVRVIPNQFTSIVSKAVPDREGRLEVRQRQDIAAS